jgi:hypothetical protein
VDSTDISFDINLDKKYYIWWRIGREKL